MRAERAKRSTSGKPNLDSLLGVQRPSIRETLNPPGEAQICKFLPKATSQCVVLWAKEPDFSQRTRARDVADDHLIGREPDIGSQGIRQALVCSPARMQHDESSIPERPA